MAEAGDMISQGISSIMPTKAGAQGLLSGTMGAITIFLIFLIVAVVIGIIIYLVLDSFKFNKKIVVWEKRHNNWEMILKDKAREIKFSRVGDAVFYFKKTKKYVPVPEIQVGRRLYWFAKREDGELINIGMGDIDLQMKQAGAKFMHPEMRAWRTAFQSNLNQRYNQPKFMEKYGAIVISIIFVAICGLILWFLADKVVSAIDKFGDVASALEKLMGKADSILGAVDNVCTHQGVAV